jgi:hypothetical protein
MQIFPQIYDIKQYWIQKMKEMWFWVKNVKICQKSPKTGKIIWNENNFAIFTPNQHLANKVFKWFK